MKQYRLCDPKGKQATILDVCATLTLQTRVTLYKRIVSQRRDVLIECGFALLLQRKYLVSADTGLSLQILFPDFNLLTVHPKTDPS